MRIAAVVRDLMLYSRIEAAARAAGAELVRVEDPERLPQPGRVDLALVDWSERAPDWGPMLNAWRAADPAIGRPRLVLFGRHTDLEAHAAARKAGLGPMWARSKLVATLSELIAGESR